MKKSKIKYTIKSLIPSFFYPLIIKYQYQKKTGKGCDLDNPKTYTEKIQWGKLHRDNLTLSKFADKIKVRKYVEETIGEEYLVPLVGGIYDSVEDIDFDDLPNQFVIKANHGCGFNYIETDKSQIDITYVRNTVNDWLDINFAYKTFELQYKEIQPKLYIEKYLLPKGMMDLPDYKFFCFNGRVYCSYTMTDYVFDHSKGRLGFFDRDYCLMPYYRSDYLPIKEQLPKPQNYEKMVEIAEKLSEGFSHVRVDLYNLNGKIYFGEMTFTTNSGYIKFIPEEFDEILGEQWDLYSGI